MHLCRFRSRHDHIRRASQWRFIEKGTEISSAAYLHRELPTYQAHGQLEFLFNHNLFYPALDFLIVLGMLRDWVVDKHVHPGLFYALPSLIVFQSLTILRVEN